MCGFVGFWGPPESKLLGAMATAMHHRGPDGDGFFEHDRGSLGYRRRANTEVDHGQQPIATEDGKIQLVYDGELYNYRELRSDLLTRGHTFRTDSDTEVVLRSYEEFGTDCFTGFNGVWGIAVLDLRNGQSPQLILSRDHFGVKPLYYAHSGERVLFGSEIKSILQDPNFLAEPDDQRIYEYLVDGLHENGVNTFFRGIKRLPAAHYARLDATGFFEHPYWQLGLQSDPRADPAEFRTLLTQAVERRLGTETPVGVGVTGALDSAAVASVADDVLQRAPVGTSSQRQQLEIFSALADDASSEARRSLEDIAAATSATHNESQPTSADLFDELEQLVWHQEEPMVSAAPYAQWCIMRRANRAGVNIVLDSAGGAELLDGKTSYGQVYRRQLLRQRRYREFAAETWAAKDAIFPSVRRRGGRRKQIRPANFLKPSFTDQTVDPDDCRSHDDLKRRLLQDLTQYSLPALLRYQDRNGAAFGVEPRQPFLDPELVEWVLKLSPDSFLHIGRGRFMVGSGLQGDVWEKIRRRGSEVDVTGFEMRWLKVRRARIQSIFRSPQFCRRKYWDGLKIADAFADACAGKTDQSLFFWRVLNVELWLRAFFDQEARTAEGSAAAGVAADTSGRTGEDIDEGPQCPLPPNRGKSLVTINSDGAAYLRGPVKTRTVQPGDDLEDLVRDSLPRVDGDLWLRPGDVLAISEKVVAISQGRSFPVDTLQSRPLARVLSGFVSRTPVGIGVGDPATMELAFREAGVGRILLAAAASAITRPVGIKGAFYRVAGSNVRAIDGPTEGTLPPSNSNAKLPPSEPDKVADRLSDRMSDMAGGRVDVVIVDANDIGVETLGSSRQADPRLVASLMRDNPLGQGSEQTPIALIRRCQTATAPALG